MQKWKVCCYHRGYSIQCFVSTYIIKVIRIQAQRKLSLDANLDQRFHVYIKKTLTNIFANLMQFKNNNKMFNIFWILSFLLFWSVQVPALVLLYLLIPVYASSMLIRNTECITTILSPWILPAVLITHPHILLFRIKINGCWSRALQKFPPGHIGAVAGRGESSLFHVANVPPWQIIKEKSLLANVVRES